MVSPLVRRTIVLNPPQKMLWTSPGLGQTNPVSGLFIRRNTNAPNKVPKNAIAPKTKSHIPSDRFSSRANGHFSPVASTGTSGRPLRDAHLQPPQAAARTPDPMSGAVRLVR